MAIDIRPYCNAISIKFDDKESPTIVYCQKKICKQTGYIMTYAKIKIYTVDIDDTGC